MYDTESGTFLISFQYIKIHIKNHFPEKISGLIYTIYKILFLNPIHMIPSTDTTTLPKRKGSICFYTPQTAPWSVRSGRIASLSPA